MKRYLILAIFLLFLLSSVNSSETEFKKPIFHTFSGGISTSFPLLFKKQKGIYGGYGYGYGYYVEEDYYSSDYDYNNNDTYYVGVYTALFELAFKFDYLFLKTVNNSYKIGFGLSIAESINFTLGMFQSLTDIRYLFFNKIQQKLTLANMFGNDKKGLYGLLEVGLTFSLVNFLANNYNKYYSDDPYLYYTTLFVGPYLFFGFTGISKASKRKKTVSVTNIVGGFLEFDFDIGQYMSNSYSKMQEVLFYLSFGVEYRIGHTMKQ